MTNTQTRIASGLVLTAIVGACAYYGTAALLSLILIVGAICIDEVFCNFLQKKRFSTSYFLTQALFIIPFGYFNFIGFTPGLSSIFVNAGVVLNILLGYYVFKVKMDSKIMDVIREQFSFLVGPFFLTSLMSLSALLHYGKWAYLIWTLLLVNFGMDIGAWLFGRNFGKTKLWPSVSPNKTVEGLFGGIFFSATIGTFLWWIFFDKFSYYSIPLFGILGALSQLGDLVESKLKRQCDIKDSSALIPGHGGFYDRVDSLVFLSPFFATALRYIYF